MMEPDFGRARVMAQKVDNDEALQESIDCCPVDCIHWVSLFPELCSVLNAWILICQLLLLHLIFKARLYACYTMLWQ